MNRTSSPDSFQRSRIRNSYPRSARPTGDEIVVKLSEPLFHCLVEILAMSAVRTSHTAEVETQLYEIIGKVRDARNRRLKQNWRLKSAHRSGD